MYYSYIRPLIIDIYSYILNTLFPITCIPCGKIEGKFICDKCAIKFLRVSAQHCIACRKPSLMGLTHPGCAHPHCADRFISIFDYQDKNVSLCIIKGKYYFLPGVYSELGNILGRYLSVQHHPSSNFILVPIPLHKFRKRWRGFNQAEVLCKAIGKELSLTVSHIITRKKATKTQKDLKREARIKNIESAFTLSPAFMKKDQQIKIQNQNYILVDDVTTTGSTLLEAVKVLKRNGAGQVWCVTVARD